MVGKGGRKNRKVDKQGAILAMHHALRSTADTSRFNFYVSIFLLLTTSLMAAAGNSAPGRTIDYVIAVVNDQAITRSALENEFILRGIENPSQQVDRKVLDELIDRKLMLQAAEVWVNPPSQEKINAEIQKIKAAYPSDALFLKELKESGLDYRELEEWIKLSQILEEWRSRKWKVDADEIEQEAAQYFEQNRPGFVEPMRIQFQYIKILSNPEAPADQQDQAKQVVAAISSQLQRGAEFGDIQRTYNDNPLVEVMQEPQMRTPNTKVGLAIAELDINKVSQPFLIPDGYLIARLLGKRLPRQKIYSEVSQQIKDLLTQKQVESQIKAWLVEQREVGNIRILDANLAKFTLEGTD